MLLSYTYFPLEHLHWAEKDMAKKCVLSIMEKPVSPSQVYLEHWSSSVLKKPLSSSLIFPQNEEEKEETRLKHSSYRQFKRAQRIISTSTPRDTRPIVLIRSGIQSFGEISQSQVFHRSWPGYNISILGSSVSLSPRPGSKLNRSSQLRVRLPQLAKGSRDGENSMKKLCILTAIKPSNVEREKAKFFKSDFRYNPQFEYSNPASPQVLEKHGKASDRFLTQVTALMPGNTHTVVHT